MQSWAECFYLSEAWRKCRAGFMSSKGFVCERCGDFGTIAHHKIWLTSKNIDDPEITLSWDNLECLCYECHAIEHMATRTRVYFDESGEIEKIRESPELRNFRRSTEKIDRILVSCKELRNKLEKPAPDG